MKCNKIQIKREFVFQNFLKLRQKGRYFCFIENRKQTVIKLDNTWAVRVKQIRFSYKITVSKNICVIYKESHKTHKERERLL